VLRITLTRGWGAQAGGPNSSLLLLLGLALLLGPGALLVEELFVGMLAPLLLVAFKAEFGAEGAAEFAGSEVCTASAAAGGC